MILLHLWLEFNINNKLSVVSYMYACTKRSITHSRYNHKSTFIKNIHSTIDGAFQASTTPFPSNTKPILVCCFLFASHLVLAEEWYHILLLRYLQHFQYLMGCHLNVILSVLL